MNQLRALHRHFLANPAIAGNAAAFIRSDAYPALLDRIEADPKEMVRLTCALLTHFALAPRVGLKVDAHLSPFEGRIWAWPHFYGMSSFLPAVVIDAGSDEERQLRCAIEENLKSKMFKAARLHMRMKSNFSRRMARLDKIGSNAYQQVVHDAHAKGILFAAQTRDDEEAGRKSYREAITARAQHARVAACGLAKHRLSERMEAVRAATADRAYPVGYYEIVAAFASQYICPQFETEKSEAIHE